MRERPPCGYHAGRVTGHTAVGSPVRQTAKELSEGDSVQTARELSEGDSVQTARELSEGDSVHTAVQTNIL